MPANPNDEPCPFCNGEPSTVTGGDGWEQTCIGFFDGVDRNRFTYRLQCSRGHEWRLVRQHGHTDEVTRLK